MNGQIDIIAAARAKALNKIPAKPTTSMRSQLQNATVLSFTESTANKKRLQAQRKKSSKSGQNGPSLSMPDLGEDEALNDRMAQARAMQNDIARENALRNKKVPSQYHEAMMMRRHPVALKRDADEDEDDGSNLSDWEDEDEEVHDVSNKSEKQNNKSKDKEESDEDLDALELDSDKEDGFEVEEFDDDIDVEDKVQSDTDSKSSKKKKDKKKKDKKDKKLKKSTSSDADDLNLDELNL